MTPDILVQLDDPMTDLFLTLILGAVIAAFSLRSRPNAWDRVRISAMQLIRVEHGASQITQQSISGTISIAITAFSVAIIGYTVLQTVWTGICSNNITQIAAAEDLRFPIGGYTANGNVTAAAMVDQNGNNNYLTSTPHDPSATINAQTTFYSFTSTVTNGNEAYTITCPGTHAGWTTFQFANGGLTKTHLTETGPGGAVAAM